MGKGRGRFIGPNAFAEREEALDEPGEVRRRWACEKSLPPHLVPLPRGEEEPFGSVGAENERGRFVNGLEPWNRKYPKYPRASTTVFERSDTLQTGSRLEVGDTVPIRNREKPALRGRNGDQRCGEVDPQCAMVQIMLFHLGDNNSVAFEAEFNVICPWLRT